MEQKKFEEAEYNFGFEKSSKKRSASVNGEKCSRGTGTLLAKKFEE